MSTIAPARRTQAERVATTRRALLDATIACVVELGYAGTTTTEVCKRAGVSQGALFRHFPSKGALLAAAVEDLFPRILEEFGGEAATISLPPGPARAAAVVDLVWAAYESPGLQAAVELYVASRTDRDLAAALAVVEPPHRERIHALAAALLPEVAERPGFRGAVDVVVDAIQGAAMGRLLVLPDEGAAARAAMRDVLVQMLTTLEGAPA